MTMVTALNRSLTVRLVVVSRCWASPLRASGGTDWLSARSMSSRSGAVYCVPVSPVRSSVVSAAVRPHSRPVAAAMPETTASSNRARGLPGSAASGSGGVLLRHRRRLSAITAVSGRGAASPACMVVATAERIACGILGLQAPRHRRRQDLAARFGVGMQASPQQRAERVLAPGDLGVVLTGMSSDGSRYDGDAGSIPAPASAAPTVGSNGAAVTCGVYRSGRTSAVASSPVAESSAALFAAPRTPPPASRRPPTSGRCGTRRKWWRRRSTRRSVPRWQGRDRPCVAVVSGPVAGHPGQSRFPGRPAPGRARLAAVAGLHPDTEPRSQILAPPLEWSLQPDDAQAILTAVAPPSTPGWPCRGR